MVLLKFYISCSSGFKKGGHDGSEKNEREQLDRCSVLLYLHNARNTSQDWTCQNQIIQSESFHSNSINTTQQEHNGSFKLEKEEAMNGLNTLIV